MTDTNNDPFAQTSNEQVNYLEYVKTKFNKDGNVDIEGLARGKYESDKHIETLTRENAELRTKADQGMSVKDLLEELRKQQIVPVPANNGEPTPVNPPANQSNPDDLAKLVKDTLNQTELERREAANKATVVSKLNEEFGANSGTELAKKASELGISVKRLEEIGKESPVALFNLLGLNGNRNVPGSAKPPTGRVQMPDTNTGDRTKRYYDELYRTNPKARHDAKITAQEHRDALRLGERFFD